MGDLLDDHGTGGSSRVGNVAQRTTLLLHWTNYLLLLLLLLLLKSKHVLGQPRIHRLLKGGIVLGRHHAKRSGGGRFWTAGWSVRNVRNYATIRPKPIAQHVRKRGLGLVLHLLRSRNVGIAGRSDQRLLHDRSRTVTPNDHLLGKTSPARRYRLTLRSRLPRNDHPLLGLLPLELHLKKPVLLLLALHLKSLLLLGLRVGIDRELSHYGRTRRNRALLLLLGDWTQPRGARTNLASCVLLLDPLHLLLLVQTLRHRSTVDDLLLRPNPGRHSRTNLKLLLLLLLLLTLHQHALLRLQSIYVLFTTGRVELLQRGVRLRIKLDVLPLNRRSQRRPDKLWLTRLARDGPSRRNNRLLDDGRPSWDSTLLLELLPTLLLNRTLRRPLLLLRLLLNQLTARTRLLLLLLNNLTSLNSLRRLPGIRSNNLLLNYGRLTRHYLLHRSTTCG